MLIPIVAVGVVLNLASVDGPAAPVVLDHLPSVDVVEHDMKSDTDRDTVARTAAALQWLAFMSERAVGGQAKAAEYLKARGELIDRWGQSDDCKDESGCEPTATRDMSRFFWCRISYETSSEFVRGLVDQYIPRVPKAALQRFADGGPPWKSALAMRTGPGNPFSGAASACWTKGQFVQDDALAEKAKGALAAKREARRAARSASEADAVALALADGKKAREAHVSMDVFGVPLGSVLTLPDCDVVGHWEQSGAQKLLSLGGTRVIGTELVSPKTCALTKSDGSTSIHWGDGALPKWAADTTVETRADVVVSVTIEFDSMLQPPPTYVVGTTAVIARAQNYKTYYEGAWKQGPENVAKAHQALRKYGTPKHPVEKATYKKDNGVVARTVEEPEWQLPGLHVKYSSDAYRDTIVIELDSVFRARQEAEHKEEAAEPKL